MPLIERKTLLERLIVGQLGLQFNGHETGDGEFILKHAGKLGFEGVVSKTIDAPYAPGNRGLWRRAKWLNRQEFVIVGWSDPEGSRPHLGALLLGYYTDDGKLTYAGRVGTGMPDKVLADLRRRLEPLARKTPPLNVLPPRKTRFGSPLVLFRVHWVEPRLVAEITYLTWTADNLLRHTGYVGLREDKPADQVRRETARSERQRRSRLRPLFDKEGGPKAAPCQPIYSGTHVCGELSWIGGHAAQSGPKVLQRDGCIKMTPRINAVNYGADSSQQNLITAT